MTGLGRARAGLQLSGPSRVGSTKYPAHTTLLRLSHLQNGLKAKVSTLPIAGCAVFPPRTRLRSRCWKMREEITFQAAQATSFSFSFFCSRLAQSQQMVWEMLIQGTSRGICFAVTKGQPSQRPPNLVIGNKKKKGGPTSNSLDTHKKKSEPCLTASCGTVFFLSNATPRLAFLHKPRYVNNGKQAYFTGWT